MPRRPKPPISPSERLRKLVAAYVEGHSIASAARDVVAEESLQYGGAACSETADTKSGVSTDTTRTSIRVVGAGDKVSQDVDRHISPLEGIGVGDGELPSLEERVRHILQLAQRVKKTPNRMLFFVMYDIESNKVRRLVSDYLLRQGCSRIQRSIFLAEASTELYEQIKADLTEVQTAYENADSIIVLPVTTDYLRQMKVIGKHIAVDVITRSRHTLFF